MPQRVKFTNFTNADESKQAVALDKVSYSESTSKLTLYSSIDGTIKEEATIPAFTNAEKQKLLSIESGATNVTIDDTLSIANTAAESKATGDAIKEVVIVGDDPTDFTSIVVDGTYDEIEFVEQSEFDDLADAFEAHKHSASDITSGTLAVGRGGTGISSNPSALTNLASTSATSLFSATPRIGVTGVLPIANGGSGESTSRLTGVASNSVTAASGFSITTSSFAWWGKVASIHYVFKKNSTAISSNTTITLGTLNEGCRPRVSSSGSWGWDKNCVVNTNGTIQIYGTVAANAEVSIYCTFILGTADIPIS